MIVTVGVIVAFVAFADRVIRWWLGREGESFSTLGEGYKILTVALRASSWLRTGPLVSAT